MTSSPFKSGLLWLSMAMIVAAAWLWNGRAERRHEQRLARMEQQSQKEAQQTAALLFRAFRADNYLTYSALSKTTARMGQKRIASLARVVHAPSRLSIVCLQGDYAGLQSGYNNLWAWRQVGSSQTVIPYVEMERPAIDMAVRRFGLMLENYEAVHEGHTVMDGRKVEVVQLRPFHPADGATGPSKKLWIDAKTGLTLRLQTFNHQMMPVMESFLSEVNFTPQITESTFVRPQQLQQVAQQRPWMAHDGGNDVQNVARLSGIYPPQPEAKFLPAGFVFDSVGAHRCLTCNQSTLPNSAAKTSGQPNDQSTCYAALSRYTDGLNTLTIFALRPECELASTLVGKIKGQGQDQIKGESKSPAVKDDTCEFGTGTLVMHDTDEGELIAVGDLPAPVLKRALEATSIRLYNSSQNPELN
jgi:negative regulator of sigma E activity